MRRFIYPFFLIILALSVFHCGRHVRDYRLVTGSQAYAVVGQEIANLINRTLREIHLTVDKGQDTGTSANIKLLADRQADFGLAQNDTAPHPDLRAVLPLFPEVLHIIYADSLQPASLPDLIRGRRIGMGPAESGTARFLQVLWKSFGLSSGDYTPIYTSFDNNVLSDSIDVSCSLTRIHNPRIEKLLANPHARLFSLDDPNLAFKGSAVDGFCLNYPQARPFIIPRTLYQHAPIEPVLTVCIDAVLLTHKEVDDELVYEMTRTILQHKSQLLIQDEIFSFLSEQFDPNSLNFPLHSGATRYLERNEPSFAERYAELFGVVFAILVTLMGGISGLARWNLHRKKDRIDVYYENVLRVSAQIGFLKTTSECDQAIMQLRELRRVAFDQLIKEKLIADESFRIFVTLLNDTVSDIREKRNGLLFQK